GVAPAATFPADNPSLGPIPDSDVTTPACQNNSTTFRDVTFPVTGLTGNVATVIVAFSASHSYLQDVEVTLRAPGGSPSHLLFAGTGTTSTSPNSCVGSSNDLSLSNAYTFSDAATANWWTTAATNPVPTSTNRTVVTGIGGTTNPPAVTSLNTTFAGLTPAQANGTWSLRFRDRGAGDTGSVGAGSLTITTSGTVAPAQHVVDFNGDGKTDFAVVRNTGGGPEGQITWYNQFNGAAGDQTANWGIATDFFVPGDYDGDSKTDLSVWRPGAAGVAGWYTLQSSDATLRIENFGQTGDDPTVIGDYNGDGKDDIAVYRAGAAAGDQSTWFYRTAVGGAVTFAQWGQNGDFPAPGDYDGDGKNDFSVQRNGGGGQAVFITYQTSTGTPSYTAFGTPSDVIVPGDYDGDGKTDYATIRGSGGQILWFYLPSSGGSYVTVVFGNSATDIPVQGDYDGDGKTDQAIWRPNVDPTQNYYYVNRSNGSGLQTAEWGQDGDYPTANYNTH
ncbi:MAG TPA: VCBS repeat-containing protein, partial [Pyrinomonadaceae bacterium]|nr:VCBS repeat-containing protein [Pyrinomonadaceae bacterium]